MIVLFFIFSILVCVSSECGTYKGCNETSIICSWEREIKWQGNTWGWLSPTSQKYQIFDNFLKAISILESFGPLKSKDLFDIHVSFQYLCCYNLADYEKIIKIYKSVPWKPFKISLSKVVCIKSGDTISIVALVNNNTQNILAKYVSTIETKMNEIGVNVTIPRSSKEPFHATIAVVDSSFPISNAVKAVNDAIRVWSTYPAVINIIWLDLPFHMFFPHNN